MSDVQDIDPHALKDLLDGDRVLLIDVREHGEWEAAAIRGASLLPLSTFEAAQVPEAGDKALVFSCAKGGRSARAAAEAAAAGRDNVYNLVGGIGAWMAAGLPVIAGPEDGQA